MTAPLVLRAWQAACLPLLDAHFDVPDDPVVVVAATGSGKSVVQAALLRRAQDRLDRHEVAVYATSRTDLVSQIGKTLRAALGRAPGRFDGHKKLTIGYKVVVTTYVSLPALVARLEGEGRRVGCLVLDEAHNSEAEQVAACAGALVGGGLRRVYGFTATAFRAGTTETLSLFGRVLYRYDYADALRDGVLVPYLYRGRESDAVDSVDGLVAMLRESGVLERGPGLVTCRTIADSERIAAELTAAGIAALPVSSGKRGAKLDEVERRFRAGDLACIVSPRKVSEGYDYPPLCWVCLFGPCDSRVKLVQTIGRALRVVDPSKHPSEVARWGVKAEAVILDPLGVVPKVGLRHDPRVGLAEDVEEKTARTRAKTKPALLPSQDYLAASEGSVAYCAALLEWAALQPAILPHLGEKIKRSKAKVSAKQAKEARVLEERILKIEPPPSHVERTQWGYKVVRDPTPEWKRAKAQARSRLAADLHGAYVVEGLRLVKEWAYSDGGAGRRTDAAIILRAVGALADYSDHCRTTGAERLRLPRSLLPVVLTTGAAK